jgi:putative ABC transport system permease protein
MNPGEILRSAFVELRHHKLRSGLTLLGIILGTLSITIMTSFLDGIVVMVWDGFRDLGFDGVMYVGGREPRDLHEQALAARSRGLQPADAELILARAERVEAVAPVLMHEELVRAGEEERLARIFGVTPSYAVVRKRRVDAGRFLGEHDELAFARVCVLGHRLKRRLFGSEEAVGRTIAIGAHAFRVVGTMAKLGNRFVNSDEFIEEMEGVYVPLATLRQLYTGRDSPLAWIAIKTGHLERLGDVKAELVAALRIAHRGAEDFRIENIAEEMLRERAEVTEVIRSWRIVLGCLAGISLVVGGIGLLSVMLISIGERVYEIGLRKAMGATDGQIFFQFLTEAVVLSFAGGILGAACGAVVTKLAGSVFPGGLPIHPGGLALAVGTSIGLGVVYGIYPALHASRMEPVEALRSVA